MWQGDKTRRRISGQFQFVVLLPVSFVDAVVLWHHQFYEDAEGQIPLIFVRCGHSKF
jgi:hypothetical protein